MAEWEVENRKDSMIYFRCCTCGKHGSVNPRRDFRLPSVCQVCFGVIELIRG
jgi:hypothetical protein